MSSSEKVVEKMITLVSSDGETFEVEEKVAMESQTLKDAWSKPTVQTECNPIAQHRKPNPRNTSRLLLSLRSIPLTLTTRPTVLSLLPGTTSSLRTLRSTRTSSLISFWYVFFVFKITLLDVEKNKWILVNSTGKVSDSYIKDWRFNSYLYQKLIWYLDLIIKNYY